MRTNRKGVFTRLVKEIFTAYPKLFPLVLVCIVFSAIVSSIPAIFIQKIIHIMEVSGEDSTWVSVSWDILRLVMILVSLYIVSLIASTFYNRSMAIITQGTLYHMRSKMFDRMQSLPIKYFDSESHGDIMSYYTNDIDTLRQMISQSIPQIVMAIVVVLNIFFIMLYYSIWMTLVVMIFVFAMFSSTKYIGKNSRKYFVSQQKSMGVTEGFLEEMIYGQKVIKIFNREDEVYKEFKKVNEDLFVNSSKANGYANILVPVINSIGNVLYVLVALVGGLLILFKVPNISISGLALTVSIVVPFLNMTKQFTGNVNQVSMQLNSIIMGLAGVERIFKLLDEEAEIDEGEIKVIEKNSVKYFDNNGELIQINGEININNVSFGYNEEKTVLSNISIKAESGEKIALVGATGSGKTTIASLINRFYDVTSGEILLDGINIKEVRKDDLRKNIGIVLQETNLFTGTVLENLRYGNLKATDSECIEACKKTGAHEFIIKLPNQYDTEISGTGDNLSQGQRQLIGISRALLEDKPVLILDEATSSIDTRTEQIVQQAMYVLMEGRTVFIIAHRLSTISNSDKIIVLDNGKILEQGTHSELMEKQGRYYQLYTGKFELD